MSDTARIASALKQGGNAIKSAVSNVNSRFITGGKNFETNFMAQVIGKGNIIVKSEQRQRVAEVGSFESDGIATHVALTAANAMIPVKNPFNGEIAYTRDGSFEVNSEGFVVNRKGDRVLAWKLDDFGKLPDGAGTEVTDLQEINAFTFAGNPKATSRVAVSARLDSDFKAIKGSGQLFKLFQTTPVSFSDVIIPVQSSRGSLKIGDTFRAGITGGNMTDFVYGGITSSKSASMGILGATTSSQMFQTASVSGEAGKAFPGDGITVTVNGKNSVLRYSSSAQISVQNGEFNSLETFAQAMNRVDNISARISLGRVYIAPKDGISSVTFSNGNSTDFVGALGIENIAAAADGVKRFSTVEALFNHVNTDPNLVAERDPSGGIKILSRELSTNVLFDSRVERKTAVTSATAQYDGPKTSRTVKIKAHDNGLRVGDFVKLSGEYPQAAGLFKGTNSSVLVGSFYVTSATSDYFTITVDSDFDDTQINQNNQIIASGSLDLKWEKTFGQIGNNVTVASPTIAYDNMFMDITLSTEQFNALSFETRGGVQDKIKAGDMVYISGFGAHGNGVDASSVADGYYNIKAVDYATNKISILPSTLPKNDATVSAVTSFNIRKISSSRPHVVDEGATFANNAGNINITLPADVVSALNPAVGNIVYLSDIGDIYTGAELFKMIDGEYVVAAVAGNVVTFTVPVAQFVVDASAATTMPEFKITPMSSAITGPTIASGAIDTVAGTITLNSAQFATFQPNDEIAFYHTSGSVLVENGGTHVSIKNGVYKISAKPTANDITITYSEVVGAGGSANPAFDSMAKVSNNGYYNPYSLIGDNLSVMSFVKDQNLARIYIGSTDLDVNSKFRFASAPIYTEDPNNAGTGTPVFDKFKFMKNDLFADGSYTKEYTIKSIDPNKRWVEIEVDVPTKTQTYTLGADGFNASDMRIDNFGSSMNAVGFSDTEFQFKAAYNSEGGDAGNNIASGKLNGSIWQNSFSVYDALGNKHDFLMGFAKIGINQWAVEVYNVADENGDFQVKFPAGTAREKDGQILAGVITFTGDGKIADMSPSLRNPTNVEWNNGSNPSVIQFDFGKTIDEITTNEFDLQSGDIRQYRGKNDIRYVNQDGFSPGDVNNISIDAEGNVAVSYTNGVIAKHAKIGIVTFANINELELTENGNYVNTLKSGIPRLREAGDAGAGFFSSGGLEASVTDESKEMYSTLMPQELNQKTLISFMRRIFDLYDKIVSSL